MDAAPGLGIFTGAKTDELMTLVRVVLSSLAISMSNPTPTRVAAMQWPVGCDDKVYTPRPHLERRRTSIKYQQPDI
jgi:hypothetical protein